MPETATRKNWTRVAFGDVVRLSKERSRDPDAEGLARYVGLEHLEPEDLKIRSWGDVADGTTFTSVFRPGQVLFGKRRAYQRKLAVAEFSGVCSGDIYVFEPANDHLMPELLPFVCQTDAFFEHAIGTSAGSLSPRTNWKSLATYEFALPPLDEQRRILGLLMEGETCLEKGVSVIETVSDLVLAAAHSLSGSGAERLPLVALGRLGEVVTGRTPRATSPESWGDDTPFATPGDISSAEPFLSSCERGLSRKGAQDARVLPAGSVLVVCIGSTIGKVARNTVPMATNQQINAVIPESIDSMYLFMCLLASTPQLVARRGTTAVPIVNKTEFSSIRIPVPAPERQQEISDHFSRLMRAKDLAAERHRRLLSLKGLMLKSTLGMTA